MTVGIYHKDCIDGTVAATVLLQRYPDIKLYNLPPSYSTNEIADILEKVSPESEVYIVDGSFGVDELLQRGMHITVIDHHIGSKEKMTRVAQDGRLTYIFDNLSSGASLTWKVLFPDRKIPRLVELVEDQDLWTWKYGNETRDVNNYLSMYRNRPEELSFLLHEISSEVSKEGAVISRYVEIYVDTYTKDAKPTQLRVGNYIINAYNVVDQQSAIGAILAHRDRGAVCLFTIKGPMVKCSFRSMEGQSPTSLELATILGGGGHVRASAAKISLEKFIELLVIDHSS